MSRCLVILSLALGYSSVFSQTKTLEGKVTFVTSGNAYIKFESTTTIAAGDTLYITREKALLPCLVVTNKSSMSCVAALLKGCEIKTGDAIVHRTARGEPGKDAVVADKNTAPKNLTTPQRKRKDIRGSVSAASYSNLSATRGDIHRTMYRLSFNGNHIGNSKFSLETYMNYRQTFRPNDSLTARDKDVFNVYSLAVRYDASKSMSLTLGRKINPKASSLGALDGLQAEKYFGNFYIGVMGGFRPDILDYKFNKDLLQFGGYIGVKTDKQNFYSETTVGLLEQRSGSFIDRRYTYFQHSGSIAGKLNIFSSFELDLYNQVNADSAGGPRLTNLFASVGYQVTKWLEAEVSYDSRKQIVYYETLKTEIERMLDNDQARQGIRYRLNVRPLKYVSLGATYSQRFQSNGQNKSDNLNAYVTWSKIPFVNGLLSVSYNDNTSSYLASKIFSVRHSRPLIREKLDGDFYYRIVNYSYSSREVEYAQRYYGAGLSYRITRKIFFSVLGELATLTDEKNYRVNGRISKNF